MRINKNFYTIIVQMFCFKKKTDRNEIKIFISFVMENSLNKKYEKVFDKSKN